VKFGESKEGNVRYYQSRNPGFTDSSRAIAAAPKVNGSAMGTGFGTTPLGPSNGSLYLCTTREAWPPRWARPALQITSGRERDRAGSDDLSPRAVGRIEMDSLAVIGGTGGVKPPRRRADRPTTPPPNFKPPTQNPPPPPPTPGGLPRTREHLDVAQPRREFTPTAIRPRPTA